MRDSTKIRQEISRLYERDPQGWGVLVGKDRHGFFDVLISHGNDAWQIKEYQVNPFKFVGFGARLQSVNPAPLANSSHPFGLRPIAPSKLQELTSILDNPKAMNEFAAELLSQKPITAAEAFQSPAVLQGPVLQSMSPLDSISSAHTKLDERLRRELQRLVHRDYRHTTTPYI